MSGTTPADHGRLLWLHPVWVLETHDASEAMTRELAPEFHEMLRLGDGYFAPGVGWSAIVSKPGTDAGEAPIRLTQLHWAYYALFMELDRALLVTFNRARWSTTSVHDRREAANSEISSPRDWIAETRARLDTELISRGGDELAIWQAIVEAQRFGVVVDAVERKIRALERLTNGLVDQAVVGEQPGVEARTEHALVRAAGRVGTADTLGADPPRDEAEPRSAGNIPPLEFPIVPRDLPTESDALRNGVSTPMPDKSASDGVNILTLATVLGFVAFLATYAATRQSIAVVVAVAVFSLVLFGSTAVLFTLMAVERARRSREEGMVAAMLGAMGVGREEVAGADKDHSRRSADEALSEALRRVRRESSRGRS